MHYAEGPACRSNTNIPQRHRKRNRSLRRRNRVDVFSNQAKSVQKLPVVIPGGADSHLKPRAIRHC